MCLNKRFFVELSYHGSNYHGWQYQPNALTVQECLDKALTTFLGKNTASLGCGRTDTGVHATQFYAHFDADEDFSEDKQSRFLKSVNALLPYDIAVKQLHEVHPEAHARFDATRRSYQYHIHFHKNPFKTQTSWFYKDTLDIEAMNRAAAFIPEFEDFGAFCKANSNNFTNNCEVSRAEWELLNDGLIFHITANRFLRNMVRAIVGTLVEIGQKKMQPEEICAVIESKNRSNAGASVPACGLFLTEVSYPYIIQSSKNIQIHG